MRALDILAAKRDGQELSPAQIRQIVNGYVQDAIPDYQVSAFLMAAFIRGLNKAETSALTQAMIESGSVLDLSDIPGMKVDKHSTGGVGDKTTLVVIPILASLGIVVPKMSGRGLGFTGGTLDKLESIPGYRTDLGPDEIKNQLLKVGAVMTGQSEDMVPADRKLYKLRDATATVESIPLIAASIMSKKIACGADTILLDVKVGSGAFMQDIDQGRELARQMIELGNAFNRKTNAVLSSMDEPLGRAVGNALEVKEAIETLQGKGPEDFASLCLYLSGHLLHMSRKVESAEQGIKMASVAIDNGSALQKFAEIVEAQDGNPRVAEDFSLLPSAEYVYELKADRSGYISNMDCKSVGISAGLLGAGRERKDDSIDHSAGLVMYARLGDRIYDGQTLAKLYANDTGKLQQGIEHLKSAIYICDKPSSKKVVCELL